MTACPSDDDLAGHLAGELDPASATAVAAHLDACAACRAVVIGAVRGGVVTLAAVAEATATVREGAARARTGGDATGETLAAGTAIGRYRIKHLLGAGGMGVVYVALDTALDREVALKVLRPDLAGDPAMLAERLVRESRLMAKASDPGVITVHDVGRDGDQVYVAMELIHGETLGKWLRRRPRTVEEVVAMFRRAGAGIGAAHRAGMVHRDFKPDNVLVELVDGEVARVLVTDFGVARAIAAADPPSTRPAAAELHLTATGVAVGTPAYMAPEQLSGQDVDERADVFGFAVALWEALYGVRPFPGATPAQIRAAMARPPTPPEDRPPTAARGRVPTWLTRALLAALVAAPAGRTPSMTVLLAALDPAPRARRLRRALAVVVALLGAGGVAVAVVAWPGPVAAPDPCAPGLDELAARWSPARAAEARAALTAGGAAPDKLAAALAILDQHAVAWREVHTRSCQAQPAEVSACLAARMLELRATADELVGATAAATRFPDQLAKLVGDPAACSGSAPALAEPNVPADPARQRAVADVRRQVFEIEVVRESGDYPAALAAIPKAEAAAAATGWDRVTAEVMYLRGSTETVGSDTQHGIETLRQAAVVAQRARYDSIAASVWIVLAHTTALDLHETDRALEYLDYAQPAVDRLGKPADLAAQLLYTRGVVEVDAGRNDDGERHLREALDIAEAGAPELLGIVVQGLAYVLENRGQHADAASQYRRALALSEAAHGPGHPEEVIYRGRLAFNLAHAGQIDEAVAQARQGLAVAEATLDEKQIDRMHAHVGLADVLRIAGRAREALPEIDTALAMAAAIVGDKSQIYGEVLVTKGELLEEVHRAREALAAFERACQILELTVEDSAADALCWVDAAMALNDLGRPRQALARLDDAILDLELDDDPVQLASAQLIRGDALFALGRRREAAAAYEAGRAVFAAGQADVGFEAAAEWGLAQALARDAPARAETLAAQAVERWTAAAPMWNETRAEAEAWLRKRRSRAASTRRGPGTP